MEFRKQELQDAVDLFLKTSEMIAFVLVFMFAHGIEFYFPGEFVYTAMKRCGYDWKQANILVKFSPDTNISIQTMRLYG